MADLDTVNDKRTLERYSKEWYIWLLNIMEKRKLDYIFVKFTPCKFGGFEKSRVKEFIQKAPSVKLPKWMKIKNR